MCTSSADPSRSWPVCSTDRYSSLSQMRYTVENNEKISSLAGRIEPTPKLYFHPFHETEGGKYTAHGHKHERNNKVVWIPY